MLNGVLSNKYPIYHNIFTSIYCVVNCCVVFQSLLYKKVWDAQIRNQLSNELMIFHMLVADEEVDCYAKKMIPSTDSFDADFCKFSFIPRALPYDETPMVCTVFLIRIFLNYFLTRLTPWHYNPHVYPHSESVASHSIEINKPCQWSATQPPP